MGRLRALVFTVLLVLLVASPSLARVATIETAVPLQDHSEQSLKAALAAGVQTLARGALAMGLSWVQVRQVLVQEDMLTIQVIATDTKPGAQPEMHPATPLGGREARPPHDSGRNWGACAGVASLTRAGFPHSTPQSHLDERQMQLIGGECPLLTLGMGDEGSAPFRSVLGCQPL